MFLDAGAAVGAIFADCFNCPRSIGVLVMWLFGGVGCFLSNKGQD